MARASSRGTGLVARKLGGYKFHGIGEAQGEVLAVGGGGAGLGALLVAGPGTGAASHEGGMEAGVERGMEVGSQFLGVGGGGILDALEEEVGG